MSEAEAIDAVAAECGNVEQMHGFRDDWELATKLEEIAMLSDLVAFEADTIAAAAKALRSYYVGTKLALIASEVVGEALDSLRDVGADGVMEGRGNVGEELADAHIRLWALENMLGIESGREVMEKIKVNIGRPAKHGRKVI